MNLRIGGRKDLCTWGLGPIERLQNTSATQPTILCILRSPDHQSSNLWVLLSSSPRCLNSCMSSVCQSFDLCSLGPGFLVLMSTVWALGSPISQSPCVAGPWVLFAPVPQVPPKISIPRSPVQITLTNESAHLHITLLHVSIATNLANIKHWFRQCETISVTLDSMSVTFHVVYEP